VYIALIAHGLWMLTLAWLVSYNYRSILNPLAYFAVLFSIQTVFSPALYDALGLFKDFDEDATIKTVGLCSLYFTCIAIPFLSGRQSIGYTVLNNLANTALLRVPRLGRFVYFAIVMQFVAFFALLIIASGTTEWITAPRTAYQESRAGVGVWWALSQSMLVLLLTALLFRRQRNAFSTLVFCLVCACGAYFLGSKAYMLYPFILAAFYYEHTVRKIPRLLMLIGSLCMVAIMLVLQILQGTASTIVDTIAYFDYFPNTAMFVADFDDRFEHTWGSTWLSSLWQYVPRGLYPDKPYIFGQTVIMEVYNPGAGERGSTPGILPWSWAYLDFGWAGVAIAGLIAGTISKGAFTLLRKRTDMISLLIFAQIGTLVGLATPFFMAPFVFFWIWLAGQLFVLHFAAFIRKMLAKSTAGFHAHAK
jgi:oligosaccharide repeat unit polymerase